MERILKLNKGKYFNVSAIPHTSFNGVVPRDLEVGDTFETDDRNGLATNKVVFKEVTENGTSLCVEVI